MEEAKRQALIRGTGERCSHPDGAIEEIENNGGECIGIRCRLCGDLFAKAFCAGCERERWCVVVSADGSERWCSHDCRQQTISGRANGTKYRQGQQSASPGLPRRDP